MKLKEKITYATEIKNGVIQSTNYSLLLLGKYEPTKVMCEISPIRSQRSIAQNSWYWSQIIPAIQSFAEHTGHSQGEIDRFLEHEFCPRYVKKMFGKERVFVKHCKELSKGEFIEFAEKVRAFVADFGITIPDPDPQLSKTRLN